MKLLRSALLLGLALCLPTLSRADLIFTLDNPVQVGNPGETFTFTGRLTNLNGPTLFLNSDTFTLDGPGLTLEDTPFLLKAPPTLASGESFTGVFFTVTAAPNALPQRSLGEFNILGGLTQDDQSLLASTEFETTVVPEPGCLALLMASLGTGAFGFCRLRRKSGNRP